MREEVEERAFMRAKEVDGKVDINQIIAEESQRVSSIAQLASVTMATLFNTDIHAAQDAARNAVDNNFAVAIPYLIAGGSALWVACDIYQTYQEQGREAALEKAGVEVVTAVVGGVVIKQGFKLAGVIYPSAELAWGAYLAQNPRVASIAEYCATKGGQVRDFITDSKVGQFIREIDDVIEAKVKGWWGRTFAGSEVGFERYWTKRVDFRGNRVYQRDDLIDPRFVDAKGRTNLERMRQGRAPYSTDNQRVELHHMLQTHDGPIAEVTRTFHQDYSGIIHINPPSIGSGIDRQAFATWRRNYWQARAKDFEL